jgi:ubiquinone/menaquinone biosynthesis C-methylase UbiE
MANPSVDIAVTSGPGEPLPFDDASFDLVIADYVLEHVEEPTRIAREIRRILKPGGWLCARTPNKWGYISIGTRVVKNTVHSRVLRWAQPGRKEQDIFPTCFRLNTMRAIRRYFPDSDFRHFSYFYQAEPSYHFDSSLVFSIMRLIDWLAPARLSANLFVFLQRQGENPQDQ